MDTKHQKITLVALCGRQASGTLENPLGCANRDATRMRVHLKPTECQGGIPQPRAWSELRVSGLVRGVSS